MGEEIEFIKIFVDLGLGLIAGDETYEHCAFVGLLLYYIVFKHRMSWL